MKIIALAGSNSSTSINKQFVTYASSLLKENVEILNLNDYNIPTYSMDIELKDGFSDDVKQFFKKLNEADVILISFAEHNGNFTAAIKSYLDWCSRIEYKFLKNAKVFALSTSDGGYGAKGALESGTKLLKKFDAEILDTFSLPHFSQNFKDDKIINEEFDLVLKNNLTKFKNNFKQTNS